MDAQDRRYTREHEWVQAEGDRARVGITDYAQKQLGDVVYVELPEVGRRLRAQEVFGTVESVKAVSELFAPLGGEVVEVNTALAGAPETINQDPYGAAWLIVLRPSDLSQMAGLMDAAAYDAYVQSESR